MDLMHENEEDSKYAFLLGSALRNNDTEQLFLVYDELIPSGISCTRLDSIKEGARYISELPEDDFNALVLNARTFSLASGRSSAVCISSMASHSGRTTGLPPDEDEECEVESIMQGEKASTTRYGSLNLQSSFKPMSTKPVDVKIDIFGDQDSGFPSSLKTTSFKSCSESNEDGDDSEEDGRGCFDYMPLRAHKERVRIHETLNPDYDEFHKVESSSGGSSVESPRSETSVTHEEYNLADDVEMQVFSSDHSHEQQGRSSEHTKLTSVNEHQHLYGNHKRHPEHWTTFNQGFHGPSLEPKRRDTIKNSYNCCQDPDFGGSGMGQQKGRISKKPGRLSKDDSDKVTSPIGLDVNGNPAVDFINYRQMRQPINDTKVGEGGSINTLPNHHSSTAPHEQPSDFEKKRLKKLKKQEKQKGELSEAITDYKGNQDLDDLLSFIEGGGNNHKKRGATGSANTAQQQNGPLSGKAEKQKKKQEKSKKELINGQEKKTTTDSVQAIPSPSVTEPLSVVMGNSTAKDCQKDNNCHSTTITTTSTTISTSSSSDMKEIRAIVEDHDHNSGEFFDCLNSLPGDNITATTLENEQKDSMEALPLPVTEVVLESSNKVTKEDNMVDTGKNLKNDRKKTPSVKTNGKEYKHQDVINTNNSDKYSTVTKHKSNFESKDAELDSLSKYSNEKTDEPVAHFIEVKKKKKRNNLTKEVGSVLNVTGLQHNHSFIPKGGNGPLYNKWRPQRPPAPPSTNSTTSTHSNNPIPSKVVKQPNTSLVIINATDDPSSLDKLSRDLSPSSFPVLMCHNNTSNTALPERRNSCGDINELKTDVSETRSYCDSDKESVKSLPAAHNVRAAGESSPLFPVSYATMVAAAQRHHGENSHSPSSESGIVCGSQNSSINSSHPHSSLGMVSPPPSAIPGGGSSINGGSTPDRKTTVWKGSPRERRHSIGSSPDDKPEVDKSSISSRNRQKSGSQECLAILLTSSQSGSKEATPSGNVKDDADPSSSESKSDVPSEVSHQSNKPDNSKRVTAVTVPTSTPTNSVGSSITTKASVVKNPSANSPSIRSTTAQNPMSLSLSSSESAVKNIPAKVPPVSMPKKTTYNNVRTGPEILSKKANTNNTKSVVFLDERFGSKATNLGITFGFDSSMDSPLDLSSSTKATSEQQSQAALPKLSSSTPSTNTSSPTVPSSKSNSLSSQQQQAVVSSQASGSNIPAVPTSPPGSSDRVHQQQSSDNNHQSSTPSSTKSTSEKSLKASRKSGPCNGLIISSGSITIDSANPKAPTSSATSNSRSKYNNSKGEITQTDKSNPPQGKNTTGPNSNIGSGNNNIKPASNPSTPCSLPLQTPPPNATEKPNSKSTNVGQRTSDPTQPQPSNGNGHGPNDKRAVPPHPSPMPLPTAPTTNSPLVMPTAFIGPAGVPLFSPHYPPPPIHQVVPMPPVPASVQTPANPNTINSSPSNRNKSEIPVSLPLSSSSSSSSLSSPSIAVTSLGTPLPPKSVSAQSFNAPIKVTYGLRIKADGGCGTIFFRPPPQFTKKQKKSNQSEVPGILKEKWTKVDSERKKDSKSYTLVGDQ